MFAWYKKSRVCYAFLSDVNEGPKDISAPNSSFRKSRWYRRGWTLQELIAPTRVLFFNSSWNFIGELVRGSTLSGVVSEITSIPSAFLEGLDPAKANVAMRMSWASARETRRKEDMAYSLLGIFDIKMPLLYGEGQKAFKRLQEELIRRTYDHTLLAWGILPWDEDDSSDDSSDDTSNDKLFSVFATPVRDFANCGSLTLCPSPIGRDFQMTSVGLRIPLSLLPPRPGETRESFIAVLDCFSRKNPSRRIAIQLQKFTEDRKYLDCRSLYKGQILQRIGRKLVVSDVPPYHTPSIYKYLSNTIHIADKSYVCGPWDIPLNRTISIDLPQDYHYDVKYIHSWHKWSINAHTVGLPSFVFGLGLQLWENQTKKPRKHIIRQQQPLPLTLKISAGIAIGDGKIFWRSLSDNHHYMRTLDHES